MATRIYLPSTGSAPVTPSTWNFGAQINPVTLAGVRTKITSAMTSKTEATGTTNPTARAMMRHVIGPLVGQTINGTVKGQMRGQESNAGANATLALAIKIIKPDGTDRAVLLAQTASDSATAGHELATALTNMSFQDAAESASISLASQTATAGDYLVIEIGFRSATGTSRNITLSYGDDSGTDLPEDTSTTAANNPWIEFSTNIGFASSITGAVTLTESVASEMVRNIHPELAGAVTIGSTIASAMAFGHNYTIAGSVPISITPASGMVYAAGGPQEYLINGAVTVSVAPTATLAYNRNASISGAVALNLAVSGTLIYNRNASINGSIPVSITIAAAMVGPGGSASANPLTDGGGALASAIRDIDLRVGM